jgi:hypothetical protein
MKSGSILLAVFISAASAIARNPSVPSFFVENSGQAPEEVKFMLRRTASTAFFSNRCVTLALPGGSLSMRFEGASLRPVLGGREKLSATANFFEGNDPKRWRDRVPMYRQLVYRDLWPGIELVYSTSTENFKSEFLIAKGASPASIRWRYGPEADVAIEADGSLLIKSGGQSVREQAPVVYQVVETKHVPVVGSYEIARDGSVGFRLGKYDVSRELIIDPVIVFTSMLGGYSQDQATAIATDTFGNILVAGFTSSTSFPVTAASRQPQSGGSADAFVAKFGGNGSYLIFCSFLGGNGDDRATGVAVDGMGNIYLTGHTGSSNFPLASAVQGVLRGSEDAFITKLTPSGSRIIYSTYLGGSGVDSGNAIAVDGYGQAYIGGDTSSTDFPILSGISSTNQGGQDGFVTKLTAAGTAIVYSTYLGGTAADHIASIAINTAGNVYVAGFTFSSNFPIVQAVQPTSGGNQDAFVTELTPTGVGIVFSTYLGGSSGYTGLPEEAHAIAIDAAGKIYVAGTTSSINFPVTSNALQPLYAGGNLDGFLTQYSANGQKMTYSSFIGGTGLDTVNAIAVDSFGYVTVAGETSSSDFPNLRGVQKQLNGNYDAFVSKFLFSGSTCSLINSSFLGGSGADIAAGVSLNGTGDTLLAGFTGSTDLATSVPLPATRAFQNTNLGLTNAFVSKIANPFFPAAVTQSSSGPLIELDSAHDGLYDGEVFSGQSLRYGNPGDIVILGDWNHTGTVKVGVFRNGLWILDWNGNGVLDSGDRQFMFGQTGDTPLVGDWNGTGIIKAGLFRQGAWILDQSGLISGSSTGLSNITTTYGAAGDIPIVGDWTGSGTTKIGVFRDGFWILDTNGDFAMNASDPFYIFGQTGDFPLTGDWDGSGISHPGIVRGGQWYLNYQWNNEIGVLGSAGTELSFTFGANTSIPMIGKVY